MIGEDGRALLTDFGYSSFVDPSVPTTSRGTLRWMAPELLDDPASIQSDIWAYGMTVLVRSTLQPSTLNPIGVFHRSSSPGRYLSMTFPRSTEL